MDVALLRLHNLERNDYGRKPTGLLSFISGRSSNNNNPPEALKVTAARCFSRIASDAPADELIAKIDAIVRPLLSIMQSS